MEKLIELLNEYEETKIHIWEKGVWRNNMAWKDWKFRPVSNRYPSSYITKYYLISKEYWFIKWLVNNDKIDTTGLQDYWDRWEIWIDVFSNMYKSDLVIMTLSIQDNPIEDLISYLK